MLTNKEIAADIRWHEAMVTALLTLSERDDWETAQLAHHNLWINRLRQCQGGL